MLTLLRGKHLKPTIQGLLIILVVLLGSFLRLYRLEETMMFQGDQGRDAIVVKRIIKDFDFTLLGPVTSVGNMYLGPLYYYFMAPWLWLTYPNPVGPAYGIALVMCLSLPTFYFMAKKMAGKNVALLGTLILAITPEAVYYSRFSWNPNLSPVAGMLLLYCLFKAVAEKRYRFLTAAFMAFALLLQLHYFNLIFLLPLIAVIGYIFFSHREERRKILNYSTMGMGVLIVSFLPLFIFNIRHGGLIARGFVEFFSGTQAPLAGGSRIISSIKHLDGRLMLVMAEVFSIPEGEWQRGLAYLGLVLGLIGLLSLQHTQYRKQRIALTITGLMLGATIAGAAIYTSSVFIHYILAALPLASLWWGFVLARLFNTRPGVLLLPLLLLFYLMVVAPEWQTFKPGSPPPNYYRMVTDNILAQLKPNSKYNLALLASNRDYKGMNYRYFLEVSDHPPQNIDSYKNLDQLIVIDELQVNDVLEAQLYEIQTPNLRKIQNQFELPGPVLVYVLEHDEAEQNSRVQ